MPAVVPLLQDMGDDEALIPFWAWFVGEHCGTVRHPLAAASACLILAPRPRNAARNAISPLEPGPLRFSQAFAVFSMVPDWATQLRVPLRDQPRSRSIAALEPTTAVSFRKDAPRCVRNQSPLTGMLGR